MTDQQMPARIWATYDGGEWSIARLSNDRLFIRADLAERMAEALEAILFEDSDKSEVDRIKDRVVARSALSAFRTSTQDTEARHD